MTFDEFVAAIQSFAEQAGAADPGVRYCDPDAWRESFDEGLTPAEAWENEWDAIKESRLMVHDILRHARLDAKLKGEE